MQEGDWTVKQSVSGLWEAKRRGDAKASGVFTDKSDAVAYAKSAAAQDASTAYAQDEATGHFLEA